MNLPHSHQMGAGLIMAWYKFHVADANGLVHRSTTRPQPQQSKDPDPRWQNWPAASYGKPPPAVGPLHSYI